MAAALPVRLGIALALLSVLAGCSSMGGLSPRSAEGTMLSSADLATALIAVDLPVSVEPNAGPRVTYGETIALTLVPADAEQVIAVLPPPAEGRSYAVYAFAEGDQPAIRSATSQPGARLLVTPGLCVTPEADKSADTVAIIAVLPGQPPAVLSPHQTLAALETAAGKPFPACQGHSG